MRWSPFKFFNYMRSMRDREVEMIAQNPFLAKAMEEEKMESHRFAVIARTIALAVVMVLLPIVNTNYNVIYYEVIVLAFIALGWLQYRMANVGYSKAELLLIFADLILLTLIFIIPNPFQDDEFPTAMLYRFDNFNYFFLILAVGTLAYSWRTVWGMGTWVAICWVLGLIAVWLWGYQIPSLGVASDQIYSEYEILQDILHPNSLVMGNRIQEIVLFLLVAGILALKGFRSNQLLMKQADISAERANLSRYFPSSLVDALASTNHDIGAVRSQEVAVLFTDIVGFTEYAERNSPEEVMDLLRDYHALVERSIFENKGTLEKYIGDGVMATFGRPETTPEDAANALRAAHQIMDLNETFNREREELGREPVRISIGIHYGLVILGDIGPERRLEFAVVGDTVNVAARLEAETRNLDCHCVVSNAVIKNVNGEGIENRELLQGFQSRGEVQLRGRSKAIGIWVS